MEELFQLVAVPEPPYCGALQSVVSEETLYNKIQSALQKNVLMRTDFINLLRG